jgi:hypothetical protein
MKTKPSYCRTNYIYRWEQQQKLPSEFFFEKESSLSILKVLVPNFFVTFSDFLVSEHIREGDQNVKIIDFPPYIRTLPVRVSTNFFQVLQAVTFNFQKWDISRQGMRL